MCDTHLVDQGNDWVLCIQACEQYCVYVEIRIYLPFYIVHEANVCIQSCQFVYRLVQLDVYQDIHSLGGNDPFDRIRKWMHLVAGKKAL